MKMAIDSGSRSPENVAWCLVDLGNMELKVGRIEEAGKAFQGALKLFPGYHPAHAGLGKLSAQAGKIAEAIEHYTKAQAAVPLPEYSAALEDLYEAAGKPERPRKQAARLAVIERMDQAAGFPANRNLALAYADHGRNLDHALAMIKEEMKTRRDIYQHDALAWVLYQNKQYAEAKQASDKALELNTPEPAFHYHAGMIALALGDRDASRKHLERALALNPNFDPKQAAQARAALAQARKRRTNDRSRHRPADRRHDGRQGHRRPAQRRLLRPARPALRRSRLRPQECARRQDRPRLRRARSAGSGRGRCPDRRTRPATMPIRRWRPRGNSANCTTRAPWKPWAASP